MTDDTQRVLGALEARSDNHDDRLDKIEASLARIEAKLAQTEGAWKMLLGVSAASSAITAGAFKLWGMLKGGGI